MAAALMARASRPETPDGRYFVARGRLCRATDPRLGESERRAALKALMQARHGLVGDTPEERAAAVAAAKRRLGETGPVWWDDGAPDETGRAPSESSYAAWWEALPERARAAGRA